MYITNRTIVGVWDGSRGQDLKFGQKLFCSPPPTPQNEIVPYAYEWENSHLSFAIS